MRTSRLIYLLFLAFIAFPCHAQRPGELTIESLWGFDSLKGKVKHIELEIIDCIDKKDYHKFVLDLDEQGNYISFMRHGKDGAMLDSIIYQYDEKHQVVKENLYPINYPPTTGTYQYKYNDQGKIVECSEVWLSINNIGGENFGDEQTYQYKYDKQGRLLESGAFDRRIFKYNEKGGATEYEYMEHDSTKDQKSRSSYHYIVTNLYNGKGYLTEVTYLSYGAISDKIKYKYDRKGNRTKEDYYRPTGKLIRTNIYKFDKKGNRILNISYQFEQKSSLPSCKILYKYDEHNNQIEGNYFWLDGTLQSKTTTQYDQTGNWIKKTVIDRNGKTNISSRIIEYY